MESRIKSMHSCRLLRRICGNSASAIAFLMSCAVADAGAAAELARYGSYLVRTVRSNSPAFCANQHTGIHEEAEWNNANLKALVEGKPHGPGIQG